MYVAVRSGSDMAQQRSLVTREDFDELRRQQKSFAKLAGAATAYHYLTDRAVAIGARAETVSGNYFQTLGEQVLAPEQAAMRVASILAGALGLFALALTAVGLYGVLSHMVVRRTRELCLRLALGPTPAQVLRLVMRDGLRPVLSGAAIGLVLAIPIRIAAHDALDEFLPIEPYLFAGVMIVFVACGAAACYWPARRAWIRTWR